MCDPRLVCRQKLARRIGSAVLFIKARADSGDRIHGIEFRVRRVDELTAETFVIGCRPESPFLFRTSDGLIHDPFHHFRTEQSLQKHAKLHRAKSQEFDHLT